MNDNEVSTHLIELGRKDDQITSLQKERGLLQTRIEYLERALKPLLDFTCCNSCMDKNKDVLKRFNEVCNEWESLNKKESIN